MIDLRWMFSINQMASEDLTDHMDHFYDTLIMRLWQFLKIESSIPYNSTGKKDDRISIFGQTNPLNWLYSQLFALLCCTMNILWQDFFFINFFRSAPKATLYDEAWRVSKERYISWAPLQSGVSNNPCNPWYPLLFSADMVFACLL